MKDRLALQRYFYRMDDAELADVLEKRRQDYHVEALMVALQEAERRGGLDEQRSKAARETASQFPMVARVRARSIRIVEFLFGDRPVDLRLLDYLKTGLRISAVIIAALGVVAAIVVAVDGASLLAVVSLLYWMLFALLLYGGSEALGFLSEMREEMDRLREHVTELRRERYRSNR